MRVAIVKISCSLITTAILLWGGSVSSLLVWKSKISFWSNTHTPDPNIISPVARFTHNSVHAHIQTPQLVAPYFDHHMCIYSKLMHIKTCSLIIRHEWRDWSVFTVFSFISFIMYNSGENIHLFPDKHLLRCVWIIQWALPLLCMDSTTLCLFDLRSLFVFVAQ